MQPSELISILTQAGSFEESFLRKRRIPKHEALHCLGQHYGLPFVEYDEKRVIPETLLRKLPLDQLKRDLWFPLSCRNAAAAIMIWKPGDRELLRIIRDLLGVDTLHLLVALPFDILATIAHHQDLNPGFPVSAGRTVLARLRTWFAAQRETLSRYRTLLAKGRTGLAFIRTGISFVSISLVLLRIFGFGYLSLAEALLFGSGLVMIYDGFLWYLPIRHLGRKTVEVFEPEPTFGTTVLEQSQGASGASYRRSDPIPGAGELRDRWNRLSPVQRRRFLAIDRTDLAEERTALAGYRTIMAQTRTGLAFTRTGIAFSGLGIGLLRQYHTGWWTILDGMLIFCGLLMTAEGFQYYLPGRRIIKYTSIGISKANRRQSIWDFMFPPNYRFGGQTPPNDRPYPLRLADDHAPGIWGTTGLALERTLIADRRTIKARVRTMMAQSRTGLAFIRTGTSILSVGMGLQVFFGFGNVIWSCFNLLLVAAGVILLVDGTWWFFPAEKMRKQFPYCYADIEIAIPDYGILSSDWPTVVFSHEDL
jgi:uncharacterized membrane protein YidH (DUF202 family)